MIDLTEPCPDCIHQRSDHTAPDNFAQHCLICGCNRNSNRNWDGPEAVAHETHLARVSGGWRVECSCGNEYDYGTRARAEEAESEHVVVDQCLECGHAEKFHETACSTCINDDVHPEWHDFEAPPEAVAGEGVCEACGAMDGEECRNLVCVIPTAAPVLDEEVSATFVAANTELVNGLRRDFRTERARAEAAEAEASRCKEALKKLRKRANFMARVNERLFERALAEPAPIDEEDSDEH